MNQMSGKNALLTGATGGIGPHIARALAANGINLVLSGRRADRLRELSAELRSGSVRIETATADLTRVDELEDLAGNAVGALGQIDILINNAGLEEIVPYQRQEPAQIQATVLTNVMAPLLLTRILLPAMLARSDGHIISLASMAGRLAMPFGSAYSGTKAALSEWALSLWMELQGTGVKVTAICPGFVTGSGMFARKGRDAPGSLGSCTPGQVAEAVVKALQSNKPEILVNSMPVRPLMVLKSISPVAAARLGDKLGLLEFLRSLTKPAEKAASE
ncbi:MAG: SDR family NAD(P)-dependent oxidoreductase [Proteobacteria bacterium]|nr:SDR family NAD(P)-dependent oxidoreductase [Pseudomonadota bacterium]